VAISLPLIWSDFLPVATQKMVPGATKKNEKKTSTHTTPDILQVGAMNVMRFLYPYVVLSSIRNANAYVLRFKAKL